MSFLSPTCGVSWDPSVAWLTKTQFTQSRGRILFPIYFALHGTYVSVSCVLCPCPFTLSLLLLLLCLLRIHSFRADRYASIATASALGRCLGRCSWTLAPGTFRRTLRSSGGRRVGLRRRCFSPRSASSTSAGHYCFSMYSDRPLLTRFGGGSQFSRSRWL